MSKQRKLKTPAHIKLRRYTVTPEHMEQYQEALEDLAYKLVSQVQEFADKHDNQLDYLYSTGFNDGYKAALLKQEDN